MWGLEFCKEPSPTPVCSSCALTRTGGLLPRTRTTKQRLAGQRRNNTRLLLLGVSVAQALPSLCSLQKRPWPVRHRLWTTLHAQDSWPRRPTRQQPLFSMRSEQVLLGEAPPGQTFGPSCPHGYLSSILIQWNRLQKSSYQKNMKPVERAAFSRLGDRPLKKPLVPSSWSTCLVRSRRPL